MDIASVSVENLTCIRGQRTLFRELSFAVSAGQVLAIEGANGIGKTSLLRMIAGFVPPAAGTIVFGGTREILDPEERGREVGWLGHHDGAKSQLTPAEVLIFIARLYESAADVNAALGAAGLARCASLPCQYLSAGQKKRLALARLGLMGRRLWLLDEPLAALDADGKKFAGDLLSAHCAGGGIALIATHEPLALASARLNLVAP